MIKIFFNRILFLKMTAETILLNDGNIILTSPGNYHSLIKAE